MATKKQLNNSNNKTEERIHLITSALNRYISIKTHGLASEDNANSRNTNIASNNNTSDLIHLKTALIMYRQHERFVNELSGWLAHAKADIDKLLKIFREKLNEVHERVKYRIAISTEKIFVSFFFFMFSFCLIDFQRLCSFFVAS